MRRRTTLGALAGSALLLATGGLMLAGPGSVQTAGAGALTIYKSPTCGCCGAWVDHMRGAGFQITVRDVADIAAIKERFRVPPRLASCHTAVSESGTIIEGHVPAADVRRFLAAEPQEGGLAVPGMPIGSPGMEMGDTRQPYTVVRYGPDGVSAFAAYP